MITIKKIILSFVALLFLVATGQSAEIVVKSPDRNGVITVTDDGGHARAENNCRETTVSVRSTAGENIELDVRACINSEATEWKLPANPLAWYQTDTVNYEGIFQNSRPEDLRAGGNILYVNN